MPIIKGNNYGNVAGGDIYQTVVLTAEAIALLAALGFLKNTMN